MVSPKGEEIWVHSIDVRDLVRSGYTVGEVKRPEVVAFDYAVYKVDGKRALKVFDEEQQAFDFIDNRDGYEIKQRER